MTSQNDTKMTITRKIETGEFLNLVYIHSQPIPVLSCQFDHLKKIDSDVK